MAKEQELKTHNATPAILHNDRIECSHCLKEDKECECNGNKGAVKTRIKFVMSLVNLFREMEDITDEYNYILFKKCFDRVVEEVNLTDEERKLFEFECQNKGV